MQKTGRCAVAKRNRNLDRPRSEGAIIELTCVSTGITTGTGEDYNRRTMNFGGLPGQVHAKKPNELWGVKQ